MTPFDDGTVLFDQSTVPFDGSAPAIGPFAAEAAAVYVPGAEAGSVAP